MAQIIKLSPQPNTIVTCRLSIFRLSWIHAFGSHHRGFELGSVQVILSPEGRVVSVITDK